MKDEAKPTFIDLCCGCGGLSLGFIKAGWRCLGGVDLDATSCRTYEANIGVPAKAMPVNEYSDEVHVDAIVSGFPCFSGDTLILTIDGMKPIEDVSVGDMVLTHMGRWRGVKAIGNRMAPSTIDVKIGGINIVTTPEHPFWMVPTVPGRTVRRKWQPRKFGDPEWIPIGECDPGIHRAVMVLPDVDDRETHSRDFWWLVGCYLAEGWIRWRSDRDSGIGSIMLACNRESIDHLRERIAAAGFHSTLADEGQSAVKLVVSSVSLVKFVSAFGSKAGNKHIPGWVMSLPKDDARALLDGYFWGDGYYRSRTRNDGTDTQTRRRTTISKSLAIGIGLLAQRAYETVSGVWVCQRPEKCIIEGREVNQHDTWQVVSPSRNYRDRMVGEMGTKRVRSITPSGPARVYNLEVEDDHSYTANGVVVKNCQPHSLSGQRLGMRDPRAMAFHGVMDQIVRLQPRVVVFENVPGLVSSKDADGKAGGAIRHVRQRMMDAGYTVVHNVLDAHAYGVPQTRLRLFMVGLADGQMWVPPREMPTDDRPTVYDAFCDILGCEDIDLPNHEPTMHRPETVERIKSMWADGRWSLYEGFRQSWARLALDMPAPTQTENHGGLCIHPEEPRVITPREMARLQTFPDEWAFEGSRREVLVQIGNAVPVGMAKVVASSIVPMLLGGR